MFSFAHRRPLPIATSCWQPPRGPTFDKTAPLIPRIELATPLSISACCIPPNLLKGAISIIYMFFEKRAHKLHFLAESPGQAEGLGLSLTGRQRNISHTPLEISAAKKARLVFSTGGAVPVVPGGICTAPALMARPSLKLSALLHTIASLQI